MQPRNHTYLEETMGNSSSKTQGGDGKELADSKIVDFDSFKILRSIGKGSFGKVCMVQKNDGKLFAMKYLNKVACVDRHFVDNVMQEIMMLRRLKHDFIVNLWYTFQDEEDFFIVVDLLLGGDLRYHLTKHVAFTEDDVRLYLMEMASVLDYLRSKCIIHRDIKPDNILLDEKGHAHLTDFNVAIRLETQESLASCFAGTKPYVAPEICQVKLGEIDGYDYSVDWWSLAVTMYELLRHKRPFKINNDTTVREAMDMYNDGKVSFSSQWPDSLINLFLELFIIDGTKRLSSCDDLKEQEFIRNVEMSSVVPHFVPSNKHLNYDPTHELEEMMIESKPLHKKKQRIRKKQESRRRKGSSRSEKSMENDESIEQNENKHSTLFVSFNRELDSSLGEDDLPD